MAVLLSGCSKHPPGTADIFTTASIVNDDKALATALSKNGTWIAIIVHDISTNKELLIEGDFHDKNDTSAPLYRKLALYAQDENRNVTDRFTLPAPRLIVKSPNTRIQGGTFKGDVYVEANGLTLYDATIDGNVYFFSQEYMNSFVLPTEEGKVGTVTGVVEIKTN